MPSKSKSQQKLFGMVHACQKYGKCASDKIKDLSRNVKAKDAEDFAKTKHDNLPERKDEMKKFNLIPFMDWVAEKEKDLIESGTSTADIAQFSRPLSDPVRRKYDSEDDFFNKKSKEKRQRMSN